MPVNISVLTFSPVFCAQWPLHALPLLTAMLPPPGPRIRMDIRPLLLCQLTAVDLVQPAQVPLVQVLHAQVLAADRELAPSLEVANLNRSFVLSAKVEAYLLLSDLPL